jgi:D-alanine--poly(phosphoribitol) ligase subunit 2
MTQNKIDIKQILQEVCEDDSVLEKDIDLIDSGLLDSYAFIELLAKLEDNGIFIQPTRIDRNQLRTIEGIENLVDDYLKTKK